MKYIVYLIAFLEWFTTLSVEIISLRVFTPIIWSNSISTSIILWVILLALSYWYYIWWKLSLKKDKIKKKLITNLFIASIYYFFITFLLSKSILTLLLNESWNYFLSIFITSLTIFFIPVFLASQTIPLLSELLKWENSWEKMWKLLFYSTIWSFFWSIATSTLFFPLLWVFKTSIISPIFLLLSAFLLTISEKKYKKIQNIIVFLLIFLITILITNNLNLNKNKIYSISNAYHNIDIYEYANKRYFSIEWWYSSWINTETNKSLFNYINEVENKVKEIKAENILVIWAAWFTFPNDISKLKYVQSIDVIDIDSSLKEITQKYFLQKQLSKKIVFYSNPTRYFLNNINKKYDLILVDAYTWKSPPSQLLTYDFFVKLKDISNNIYINIIIDSELKSDFSKNLFSTINKAFNQSSYKEVNNRNKWLTNIIITNNIDVNYKINFLRNQNIYFDNKNSIEIDIFKMFWVK